jgi:hypothetical protein
MLKGSTEILNTVTEHLGGIHPGDTTKDGKFTVVEVECQGACSNAPMMAVNDDFYVRDPICSHTRNPFADPILCFLQEDLTPESTRKILDAFAAGKKPKPGPQSGRHTSENSAGLTALTSKVRRNNYPSMTVILTISTSPMVLENIACPSLVNCVVLHFMINLLLVNKFVKVPGRLINMPKYTPDERFLRPSCLSFHQFLLPIVFADLVTFTLLPDGVCDQIYFEKRNKMWPPGLQNEPLVYDIAAIKRYI